MDLTWVFILAIGLVCWICMLAGVSIAQAAGIIPLFGLFIWLYLWMFYDRPIPKPKISFDLRTSFDRTPTSSLGNPVIKPVTEAEIPRKPVMARLPQIILPPLSIEPVAQPSEVLPNFTTPPSPVEESLLLRVLGLGMFALSVIAIDFAAGTHYSWLGIPFVTAGAAWSWYRRHYARNWLNIAVSIVSLGFLFGSLVPNLFKDMQVGLITYSARLDPGALQQLQVSGSASIGLGLGLGMLLVSLQMGLSFHLYSRKVLGYGMVISSSLMGVAAILSQNLGFLILLAGFLPLAIPALMLDYRSRLALQPVGVLADRSQQQLPYQHLPWKYLSQLAAISIGLGLILAVFLPNFHVPNLSFPSPGLNKLDGLPNVAQKYPPNPQSSPSTPAPPQLSPQEMARKILGQPGNNNYPDTIKQDNLQLPSEIASQLQQFTQQILATSPQPLNSDFDRATYLGEYLKQHYQVDSRQADRTKLPPLDAKSLQQLMAQCPPGQKDCKLVGNKQDLPVVYPAMLRSIGIPARLKTGEKLAELDPQTKLYPRPPERSQSQTDVYFPNWGWFGMDSTPVGGGEASASTKDSRPLINPDARQIAQLQQQMQSISRSQPAPKTDPIPASGHPKEGNSSIEGRNRNSNNPKPIDPTPPQPPSELTKWEPDPTILKIVAIAISICGGIAWYLWYRHHEQQQLAARMAGLPPVEQIYRSMLIALNDRGSSKKSAQTQLEYARSISTSCHPQIAKVVWEMSQAYTAWRYGKQRVDVKQLAKQLQYLQHLQQLAAQRQRQQWFSEIKARWKSNLSLANKSGIKN